MKNVTFLDSASFDRALLENKYSAALDRNSDDWQDAQFDLTGCLEEELKSRYGVGAFNRDEVFISSEVRPAKVLHMDIYDTLLSPSLVDDLLGFLERNAPDYAILSSINRVDAGLVDLMVGQSVVSLQGIWVEEAAAAIWNRKVSP